MYLPQQLAQQFRAAYLDSDWVAPNLKRQLSDVTWEEATTLVGPLHSIADLAFHIGYYIAGVAQVLEGGPLEIRDRYSFECPLISSAADWEALRARLWRDAERFARLVEEMPAEQLAQDFVDEKYGSYLRNIQAMIEHSYYHLGQIALLKKLLRQGPVSA